MKFRFTARAAQTLGLPETNMEREFDGPATRDGLLMGYTAGEVRWLRKHLGVTSTTDIDIVDARIGYYFLAIRREDHTLWPPARFDDLAVSDFELVQHEVVHPLDDDGDCGECHQPVTSGLHTGDPGPDPTRPAGSTLTTR